VVSTGSTFRGYQSHKRSESMQEAESSVNRLIGLVEGLVADNADLRLRFDTFSIDYTAG
jgi:hypothetical protein